MSVWLSLSFPTGIDPVGCTLSGLMLNGSTTESCADKELIFEDVIAKDPIPVTLGITSFGVHRLEAMAKTNCFGFVLNSTGGVLINDTDCADLLVAVCELDKQKVPVGVPDYDHSELTCPALDTSVLDSTRLLKISDSAPSGAYCVGTK